MFLIFLFFSLFYVQLLRFSSLSIYR